MRTLSHLTAVTSVALTLALFSGCRGQAPAPANGGESPPLSPEAAQASGEIGGGLSQLINESSARFRPLNYEYDEDLLITLDRVDEHLSGKATGPFPRALPKLDEQEEMDHFRETIRRWQAKTGKDFRTEIDKLKAEIATRKPGDPPFHPEFHKHFSTAFDDLIPIEVAEIRERRNRYLHEKAKPLFDKYRDTFPDVVRQHEDSINTPPYNLTPTEPAAKKS